MDLMSQISQKSYHNLSTVHHHLNGDSKEDVVNNNTITMSSLSDQTSHVAGLTAAALDVVNSSPEEQDAQQGYQHVSDEEVDPLNLTKLQAYLVKQEPLMHQEQNLGYMMGGTQQPVSSVSEVVHNTEENQYKSLAPLVNVHIGHNTSSQESNSYALTAPTNCTLPSPIVLPQHHIDIPRMGDNTENRRPTFEENYQPIMGQTNIEHSPDDSKPVIKPARGRKRKVPKAGTDLGDESCQSGSGKRTKKEGVNRPPPHVLPPCKVCGIQATGFHYGVNTCEACKGFFRRSIIRKQPYACANNPIKCMIAPGKRNTCPACRYKKCTEAGMSVEGIKIGRYTYAKRTQDILELQETKDEDADDNEFSDSPEGSISEALCDMELIEFIQTVVEANESKSAESLKNLGFVEQIQERVKQEIGDRPADSTIPMEEFLTVLNTTGVQLDDRFQVLQQWIALLNDGLRYVITFAKDIPGFKELSMTDQMALIKHSICEVWLISRHRAVHQDFDLFTTRTGLTLDIVKALGEDFGNAVVKISRKLRKLELTIEETIMLKAMAIFFTDRCEVEESAKVAAIQNRLLDALLYLFSQRGVNMALTMGRISSVLTDLRHMTEFYQNYTKKLRIISTTTGVVDLPPLFLEIITFT